MKRLVLFSKNDCQNLVNLRKGETKFGQDIQLLDRFNNIYDDLLSLDVDYVIFGIKEDIGVMANHGKTGTHKAWDATLKNLLNIQSNTFTKAKRVLILGHLNYNGLYEKLMDETLSGKKKVSLARKLVETIDIDVAHLVYSIVKSGKTPIVIGGGHNNAYGNIKGTSLALKQPVNAVNFDAHHDFRDEEGRHSGNGFSYTFHEGFLNKYFIFGLHENYISQNSIDTLNKIKAIAYSTFEDIEIRKKISFKEAMEKAITHAGNTAFGLEIDCDAIENVPSSAMSPSGFSVNKVRRFVTEFGQSPNVKYLHICEASPSKKNETTVGKLITYLITDFIKANAN